MNSIKSLRKIRALAGVLILWTVSASAELAPTHVRIGLKESHITACIPTISNQLQLFSIAAAEAAITAYCGCLGTLYFDDLTIDEYDEMGSNQPLPGRKLARRNEFQELCADNYLE